MNQIEILLPFRPIAWTVRLNAKTCRLYNPHSKQFHFIRTYIFDRFKHLKLQGAITLQFFFGMPIPASAPKARKLKYVSGEIEHTCKPDTTNMQKFYEDCLTGILFDDDCQVVKITSEKQYCEKPFVKILLNNNFNTCYEMFTT